jgi:uncharacterized protein
VEPKYKLGNINETHMIELIASDQQLKFGRDKFDTLPQYCLGCDVRFICHGGRPKDRFINTLDGQPGLNYLGAGYQASFHHIDRPMKLMVQLLRQNRAPSELVRLYATKDQEWQALLAKTGRNDPCLCGSDKKLKNCHGRDRP